MADPVENRRFARLAGRGFFLLLDLRPEIGDLLRRPGLGVAEDMGVAADHLLHDMPGHVGVGEFSLLLRDNGLKQHVHEEVAEFVADIGRVVPVDRIEQFGALFGQTAAQGEARLFGGSHGQPPGARSRSRIASSDSAVGSNFNSSLISTKIPG